MTSQKETKYLSVREDRKLDKQFVTLAKKEVLSKGENLSNMSSKALMWQTTENKSSKRPHKTIDQVFGTLDQLLDDVSFSEMDDADTLVEERDPPEIEYASEKNIEAEGQVPTHLNKKQKTNLTETALREYIKREYNDNADNNNTFQTTNRVSVITAPPKKTNITPETDTDKIRDESEELYEKYSLHRKNALQNLFGSDLVKPFTCNIRECNKIFRTEVHLKIHHTRTHRMGTNRVELGENSIKSYEYQCDFELCYKTFRKPIHLEAHILVHKGIKPFKCDSCEKSFTRQGELKRHEWVHTKPERFNCDTCDRKFSRADHQKNHNCLNTSGMVRNHCGYCNRRMSRVNLQKHKCAKLQKPLATQEELQVKSQQSEKASPSVIRTTTPVILTQKPPFQIPSGPITPSGVLEGLPTYIKAKIFYPRPDQPIYSLPDQIIIRPGQTREDLDGIEMPAVSTLPSESNTDQKPIKTQTGFIWPQTEMAF